MGSLFAVPSDFLYRLADLQGVIRNVISNPAALVSDTSDPLYFQLLVVALIHVYTYTNGILFDWSGVDRLWSITPMIYANSFWIFKYLTQNVFDPRLFVMSSLVTLWGTRLTYNFYIKGMHACKHPYIFIHYLTNQIELRWISL